MASPVDRKAPVPLLYLNHDLTSGGAERALLNVLGRLVTAPPAVLLSHT